VPLCPYHPWLLWVIIWCVPSFYFRFQPIRTHLFSRDIGRIMDHTYLPIRAYGNTHIMNLLWILLYDVFPVRFHLLPPIE
jgi:hypothetical protein